MATPNFELKRGVLLESFGHPEKTCTNDTLTDALAEWHLRENPGKAIYFSRIPGGFVPSALPPPAPPPAPPRGKQQENRIVEPEVIILPKQEDPVKRKLLVDKALELGFKPGPESPVELIKSEELEVIISNLEKVNISETIVKKKGGKKPNTKK